MTITYLKKAEKSPATGEDETRKIVASMLDEIEKGGEEVAKAYGVKLDNVTGNIVVTPEEIEAASGKVSQRLKDDIQFAYDRVARFARAQRASISEFETELSPGLWAGQKLIPMETAGCYVPGGRYAHVASAIMSVGTAREAGVKNVIACSAPKPGEGINPAILYTMNLCGADHILALGGVQGIAAMTFGLFTGKPANFLAGPGNRFVAEAKRMLYGRVGIDLFAGPTETLIIADETVDGELCATDLLGQAEHGPTSPAVLLTTSEKLARETMTEVERLLKILPTADIAAQAWRDYGEVIVCDSYDEMLDQANWIASEHVQVMTDRDDWFLDNMTNYGALFLGARTNVSYGDKVIGTNHTLPTKKAGRYTGGLWVGKFIKTHTYQRVLTDEASALVGEYCSRLCMLEGFIQSNVEKGGRDLERYWSHIHFFE